MSVFQIKRTCPFAKSTIIKAIVTLFILLLFLSGLNAQKESNIKLKIEAGALILTNSKKQLLTDPLGIPGQYGIFFNLEGKFKTSKKTFIGLRLGASSNEQSHVNSLIPTFDYYFIGKKVRPYLGLGIGYFFVNNPEGLTDPSGVFDTSITNKAGFIFRAGLDISNYSVGIEYNYIPEATIETADVDFL